MTIYAIVNSLLVDESYVEASPVISVLISPSGILQGGNPYFVPDFAPSFEARIALAVRIGKLGKGIATRFAHRYVEAVSACLLFVAPELLTRLRKSGFPWTQALSYDRCLAIGKFVNLPFVEIPESEISLKMLTKDSEFCYPWTYPQDLPPLEEIISQLSRDNTLKTGDIIIVGLTSAGPRISPGMQVNLHFNGVLSSKFNIR